jgi:hypothetical protein
MAGITPEIKLKVVITQDMGPDSNALLESSKQWPSLQVLRWEEDRPAPRDWLLRSVSGATALLITLCDKARPLSGSVDPSSSSLIEVAAGGRRAFACRQEWSN